MLAQVVVMLALITTPVMDCKKEWVSACVRSDQDKYRDWYPPKMHTDQEVYEIMKRSKHICEFTDKGPCAK